MHTTRSAATACVPPSSAIYFTVGKGIPVPKNMCCAGYFSLGVEEIRLACVRPFRLLYRELGYSWSCLSTRVSIIAWSTLFERDAAHKP